MQEQANYNEKRQFVRKTLYTQVTLFEQNSMTCLGLMADYSEGGLMLSSYQPLEIEKEYDVLMMDLPNNIGRKRIGHIKIKSVWCKQISNTQYGVGFMLISSDKSAQSMFASYDAEYYALLKKHPNESTDKFT
ncbi:PilZ domain-containing protein [Bermanella marisrubri]|uniref:Fructokinase n=1 Tax=Bermanella marisrubri TaxID=207949 RepID=Q1MZQ7_9GAMM|nr:PilZ domain-containing protein [Bermanella marisrubri]EAT11500.1 fructokinase [Oceanobacter sp. RED65] [Bermanella marisrubri]QIZ85075.1 PilZ domain-containing protein [Bermanella marisrubri]